MFKVVFLLMITACSVCSFLSSLRRIPSQWKQAKLCQLGSKAPIGQQNEIDIDPYDGLLDLDKPVKADTKESLFPLVSISTPETTEETQPRSRKSSLVKSKKHWEHWDEWMEQEFGDVDAELKEEDKWVLELRDILEQKRGMSFFLHLLNANLIVHVHTFYTGYAIWSKKSDQEIQREVKKNLASKSLQLPEAIVSVIRAVYIEKTFTMKEFKKENELACLEFRKWMIAQRGKLKKDPLPQARAEVSRKWLMNAPSSRGVSRKKGQLPSIVMDECMEPVPGVAFASESSSAKTSSTSSSTLITSSMINWEKSALEVAAATASAVSSSNGSSKDNRAKSFSFCVDGEEVFLASNPHNEYFVVL